MKTIPFVLLTTVIGCYGQSGELSKLSAEIKILSEITDGFENKLNQILTENAEKMARAGEEQDKLLTKIKDLEYELEMEREKNFMHKHNYLRDVKSLEDEHKKVVLQLNEEIRCAGAEGYYRGLNVGREQISVEIKKAYNFGFEEGKSSGSSNQNQVFNGVNEDFRNGLIGEYHWCDSGNVILVEPNKPPRSSTKKVTDGLITFNRDGSIKGAARMFSLLFKLDDYDGSFRWKVSKEIDHYALCIYSAKHKKIFRIDPEKNNAPKDFMTSIYDNSSQKLLFEKLAR